MANLPLMHDHKASKNLLRDTLGLRPGQFRMPGDVFGQIAMWNVLACDVDRIRVSEPGDELYEIIRTL